MHLQKKTGGSGVGEFVWADDGDVVEVPDALGEDLLRLAPDEYSVVIEVGKGGGATEYDELKVDALRELLKQRGLEVSGKKEDLVQRLVDADTADAAAAPAGTHTDSRLVTE